MPVISYESRFNKRKIAGIVIVLSLVAAILFMIWPRHSSLVYVEYSFVEEDWITRDTRGSGQRRGTIFAEESGDILIRAPWSSIGFEEIASSDGDITSGNKPELKTYSLKVRFPSPQVGIRDVHFIGLGERGEDVVLYISSDGVGRGDYGISNDTESPSVTRTYDAKDLSDIARAVTYHTGQQVNVFR